MGSCWACPLRWHRLAGEGETAAEQGTDTKSRKTKADAARDAHRHQRRQQLPAAAEPAPVTNRCFQNLLQAQFQKQEATDKLHCRAVKVDVAECWSVTSMRSTKKEQTQRRNRGELKSHPLGDCWIEEALRRKYIEATKELEKYFVECFGRSSGHSSIGSKGTTFHKKKRDDGTVVIHKWITDVRHKSYFDRVWNLESPSGKDDG